MSNLNEDLVHLAGAIEACRGRVDADVLSRAQSLVVRVDRRLSLSRDTTVIAIAGTTGSGKSSVFNALTRTALAEPGVRRPMTEHSLALTFGDTDTSGLLDWLGITRRHVAAGQDLTGVVLLDLTDCDSVITSHRDEVDRLVEVVDQFFWVVDPQKYADAALHQRYLHPFAGHSSVMTFVLNQVDRLTPAETADIHKDLVRLLEADGIPKPSVMEVSALTGQGIDALRRHAIEIASSKHSMVARLRADILQQAHDLRAEVGTEPAGTTNRNHLARVTTACLEAAGADQIEEAVRTSVRLRGHLATGSPLLSWLGHFKVDPLKRLHLDQFRSRKKQLEAPELTKTGLTVHPVARARIDTSIRLVSDEATARLPLQWRTAVDRTIKDRTADLPSAIDQAVASTDLGLNEGHGWWTLVRALQWLLFLVAVGGLLWLIVNFVLSSFLGLPTLPTPKIGNLPLPTWLTLGGIVAGLLLAGLARIGVNLGARVTALGAVKRLRKSMESVASREVIGPLNDELSRHDAARVALDQIIG